MGIDTDIEWCDSSLQLEMGCDGCELWNPKVGEKTCYAGQLTNLHGGPERNDCERNGVAYFHKQWGEWAPRSHGFTQIGKMPWGTIQTNGEFFPNSHDDDGGGEASMIRVGKKLAGAMIDGRRWTDVPPCHLIPANTLPVKRFLTRP